MAMIAASRRAAVIARGLGLAQAFENGLKLGQIRRVVAHTGPERPDLGDGEGRIEREAGLDCGMRLVQSTKLREGGGQLEKC